MNLGVFWPASIYKKKTGEDVQKSECTTYTHGAVTYRGTIRDASFGNPTGAISLASKASDVVRKVDILADSREDIRGLEQVSLLSATRTRHELASQGPPPTCPPKIKHVVLVRFWLRKDEGVDGISFRFRQLPSKGRPFEFVRQANLLKFSDGTLARLFEQCSRDPGLL